MIGNDVLEELEPEEGEGGEDFAFIGDRRWKDDIKGGDAVCCDEQEMSIQLIDITHFSPFEKGKGKLC